MKALSIWAAHDSPSKSRAHLIPAFLCMCLLFLYSPVPQSGKVQRDAGVKEIFSFSISKHVFCSVLIYECRDSDLYYIDGSSSQLTWHWAQVERLCSLCHVLAVILPYCALLYVKVVWQMTTWRFMPVSFFSPTDVPDAVGFQEAEAPSF